jgi:hypothetical protein
MKKLFLYFTAALLFCVLSLVGCSSDSAEEPEKGAIRKMTDEVAHDLSHKMRSPIDKARALKDQEEDRLNDFRDTADESSRAD